MAWYTASDSAFISVADAIRTAAGTSSSMTFPSGFIDGINSISGGGTPEEESVIFIDYDGTVLYSYTPTQFAALSAMPANPSHEGLTAQGWNWDLESAKGHVELYKDLIIGQMYITSDEKTYIHIKIEDEKLLSLYLGLGINGNVDIDWGDESTHTTLTGTSTGTTVFANHKYESLGSYIIKLSPNNDTAMYFRGDSSYYYGYILNAFGSTSAPSYQQYHENYSYLQLIQGVNLGKNCSLYTSSFGYCSNLSFITIPNSVSFFSSYVFKQNRSLTAIVLPTGLNMTTTNMFGGSTHLKTVSLPSNLLSIGQNSFDGCYNLTSITLPSKVSKIYQYGFRHCENLTITNLPKTISYNAFENCLSLENVTLPSEASIDDYAFQSCYSLASISMPDVSRIGYYAFQNCTSLKSVDLGKTNNIQQSLFDQCRKLQSITLTSAIQFIGSCAFQSCHSLSSIDLSLCSAPSIGTYAFQHCYALESISLPTTITQISQNAFANCVSLKSIDIPSSTTFIGQYAFSQTQELKTVTLPTVLSTISTYTFSYSGITSITIPSNIQYINAYAFTNCQRLINIRFERDTVPYIQGQSVWNFVPTNCKIQVPYTAFASYLSAPSCPAPSSYTYYGFATYPDQTTLPTQDSTQAYNVVWYGTLDDAAAQSNAITVGNGNEIYCRYTAV